MSEPAKQQGHAEELRFPSTHWSSIFAANQPDPEQAKAALGRLLERYRQPLVAYLREKLHADEEQARDWLQSFVAEQVLQKEILRRVEPLEGKKFRSFLLCTLHHYVISQIRRDQSQKRLPEGGLISLETLEDWEAANVADPAKAAYDLAWAHEVLTEALAQMESYCATEKRPDIWGVFDGRIRGPLLDGVAPVPYDQLVERYGLRSQIQAHNVKATGKRLLLRCLRAVIAEYAVDEKEVEAELLQLQQVFSR